jgi:hypothetical protein
VVPQMATTKVIKRYARSFIGDFIVALAIMAQMHNAAN